jgi:hypothetical protein
MQVIFLAILAALAATVSAGDVVEDKEKLTFKADGTFKILHLSDVHYKVHSGWTHAQWQELPLRRTPPFSPSHQP